MPEGRLERTRQAYRDRTWRFIPDGGITVWPKSLGVSKETMRLLLLVSPDTPVMDESGRVVAQAYSYERWQQINSEGLTVSDIQALLAMQLKVWPDDRRMPVLRPGGRPLAPMKTMN